MDELIVFKRRLELVNEAVQVIVALNHLIYLPRDFTTGFSVTNLHRNEFRARPSKFLLHFHPVLKKFRSNVTYCANVCPRNLLVIVYLFFHLLNEGVRYKS